MNFQKAKLLILHSECPNLYFLYCLNFVLFGYGIHISKESNAILFSKFLTFRARNLFSKGVRHIIFSNEWLCFLVRLGISGSIPIAVAIVYLLLKGVKSAVSENSYHFSIWETDLYHFPLSLTFWKFFLLFRYHGWPAMESAFKLIFHVFEVQIQLMHLVFLP